MERGIIYDQNQLDILPGEVWLPIPESVIPGIRPYYYISNKGRVWSSRIDNTRIISYCRRGYAYVNLKTEDKDTRASVHRLVMLVFNWIPGCEDLEVNHKDGNKSNNDITNLEWVTPSQNLYHAYENGLKQKGEFHANSTHTEKQVRIICEGLEQRKSLMECAILAGLEPNHTSEAFVSNIKNKITWGHISDEYDIPKGQNNQVFTDKEVHQICKYIQNGLSNNEILELIKPGQTDFRYQNALSNIRGRRRLTRISDNYEF